MRNLILLFALGIAACSQTRAAQDEPTSAEQQDAQARMYGNGEGVPKDYAKAMEWYMKAAAQGDASAQFDLGGMYDVGEGVPKDYAKAAGWYTKAAEQGHSDAQFNLGALYVMGEGVPQDYAKAYAWLLLAAAQGHADARKASDDVEGRLTPEQTAEGQRMAREISEKIKQAKD